MNKIFEKGVGDYPHSWGFDPSRAWQFLEGKCDQENFHCEPLSIGEQLYMEVNLINHQLIFSHFPIFDIPPNQHIKLPDEDCDYDLIFSISSGQWISITSVTVYVYF